MTTVRLRYQEVKGYTGRKQPSNKSVILKGAFYGISCLECGKCCRMLDSVHFYLTDKNFQRDLNRFKNAMEEKGQEYWIYSHKDKLTVLFYFKGNKCPFLGENGIGCSIQDEKPLFCRPFPVNGVNVGYSSNGREKEGIMLKLDTTCPIIELVGKSGVTYVTGTEIEEFGLTLLDDGIKTINKFGLGRPGLPFLVNIELNFRLNGGEELILPILDYNGKPPVGVQ